MPPFPSDNLIEGMMRCGRYAFMPNYYAYCGPDKNKKLLSYVAAEYYDPDLNQILSQFEVMHPYLKLIAHSNNIANEFSPEVVEAYWLGNQLTENVKIKNLYRHFTENNNLKSKLRKSLVEKVLGLIPSQAKPHHNFHVMNIWARTGAKNIKHTLKSIDECRISWGKVKEIKKTKIVVDFQPLVIKDDKLQLGEPIDREAITYLDDKSFVRNLKIGDIVTIHWGFVCEKINNEQLKNLRKYTEESLRIFNQQIKEFLYA